MLGDCLAIYKNLCLAMPDYEVGIILINYQDYAQKYLPACLESLRRQEGVSWRLFIVDNASSPDSRSFLKETAPEAELIINNNNDGFAKGNNDALKILKERGCAYAWVLNMDTQVAPDALSLALGVLSSDKTLGAVQSRLMLFPEKDLINSLGNTAHFLGFGYCLGYREALATKEIKDADIFYPSGAAVLFRLSALDESGLFDENFWMYNEDQDLGWRLWLLGYRSRLASASVVWHQYEFSRSISKYYWMDRNRTLAIIKNYSLPTLIFIFPAWLLMEFGLFIFSLKSGWFKEKLKVWAYFCHLGTWRYLYHSRRKIQSRRRLRDREILPLLSGRIWYQEIGDWKLRLANPFFQLYFSFIKLLADVFRF